MTDTGDSLRIFLPQLLYSLPIILTSLAAAVVCIVNWQKAPTAAMFCLIGFGLIGFNSFFGSLITSLLIHNNGGAAGLARMWSFVSAGRILLSIAGYVFLLIAVFSGRKGEIKPNVFESAPNQSGAPQ